MRFPVQVHAGQLINFNRDRFTELIHTSKDGDYEIIFRKKVNWDVEQMRNYFHGPVLDFIQEQFKKARRTYGKKKIKEMLKEEFGSREHIKVGKKRIWDVKSTGDYTHSEYYKFLSDLNTWCIDCFECELPNKDEE